MLFYCLKFRKNTEGKNPKVVKTKSRKKILSSNCGVCGNKKSRFIKEQEAKGILDMIGKIPLLGDLLI